MVRKLVAMVCLAALFLTLVVRLSFPNGETLLLVWTPVDRGYLDLNVPDRRGARLRLGEQRLPRSFPVPLDACYAVRLEDGYLQAWTPTYACHPIPLGRLSFLLALMGGYVVASPSLLRYWRRKRGLCQTCGYDLTGNVSGTCPECGKATPTKRRQPQW